MSITSEYPYLIIDADGQLIDAAGNVESAESVLYGDLSYHDGRARVVRVPMGDDDALARLRYAAEINADCFGLPLDRVETYSHGRDCTMREGFGSCECDA